MKPSFILKSSIRLDLLFAAYAEKTALIAPSGVRTFNDVREILRTVIFNLESAGVRKGHRVALYCENNELHLYLFLAAWIMDFLYIPLDFKAPLELFIRGGNSDFLITDRETETTCGPVILHPENIRQCSVPFPAVPVWPAIPFSREVSVIFTSGSTGKPRGIVHTAGNYVYSAWGTNEFIGLSESDRWLISLPLFHVGGVLIWVRTLLCGGTAILPDSLKNIDQAIKAHRPSVLSLVPAQLIRLLSNNEMTAILQSCRAILLGGAATPAWLIAKALDLAIPIMPTYGSTEACAQVTGVAKDSPKSAYKTAGLPLPYREVLIDTDGSILLKGETLFKRYLEDRKPRHIRNDGFFKTADAGYLDGDGNLVCLGRTDGIFISGGENIHPAEIENQLMTMAGISAAYVVPVFHREFGQIPWAFIETESPCDEKLIIASLNSRLPGYKIPKRIVRLDPVEKKEKMKYSREALRALAGKMAKTVLNFTTHGSEQSEALVFLHGFMGQSRSFASIIAPLCEKYRVITFDLPGHGESLFGRIDALKSLQTMEDVARLVLQDLDSLGIDHFSIYGYSMGGRVAESLAILAPERVQRLILESASFGIADPTERQQRYLQDQRLLSHIRSKDEFAAFLADWYNLPLFRTLRGTPLLELMIREKLDNDVAELGRALAVMSVGHHPFFLPRLAALNIPFFYFSGEQDEAYQSTAACAKQSLPEMEITIFRGASHNIHCQYPAKILSRLETILARGVKS